ncbi:DUF2000 domain-containing protein [Enterococcus pallens]|uniref:DUF2000 domain-containing protein n=1 Tax=Enterococcus pallens ATCC BAA-351 TaxID=1158607 RepID=R2PPV8_9ENTE|nr:DUF2000 domain-containing protein [Enterococcus pallens]EOH86537.1 hypothetical protein UAU_04977 [Enterococcus pallens ATCC BAA-351]EOU18333.1 hypothetical protein I588_03322 [Enterococcus pallens ATCC BAA-351]
MNSERKCVMVVDEKMPLGIIANSTAVMGVTIGKLFPEVVGQNVFDQTGYEHQGIIEFPIPILKGNKDFLRELKEKIQEPKFEKVTVVDFFDAAQSCKTYEEYIEKMKDIPESALQYFGLTFFGPKKQVNQLTGSLPLLR